MRHLAPSHPGGVTWDFQVVENPAGILHQLVDGSSPGGCCDFYHQQVVLANIMANTHYYYHIAILVNHHNSPQPFVNQLLNTQPPRLLAEVCTGIGPFVEYGEPLVQAGVAAESDSGRQAGA